MATEQVNHPSHYQREGRKECIEEMLDKFGSKAVYIWCVLNAYKYNYRKGAKENNPEDQDAKKAEWYIRKAYDLEPGYCLPLRVREYLEECFEKL